jgi:hypothetical protein
VITDVRVHQRDAFQRNALTRRGLRCRGRRPWLAAREGQPCDAGAHRVLQRGASNVYYPQMLGIYYDGASDFRVGGLAPDLGRIVEYRHA